MSEIVRGEVTQLLERVRDGDQAARNSVVELLYSRFRSKAALLMRGERNDHTWQATALVHEAYVKLDDAQAFDSDVNTAKLNAMMCHAMQEVLIDHARERSAMKRGGDRTRVPLDDVCDSIENDYHCNLIDLSDALEKLRREHPKVCQVVDCKFFGFMSEEEIAVEIGISISTVQKRLRFARAWLYPKLSAK